MMKRIVRDKGKEIVSYLESYQSMKYRFEGIGSSDFIFLKINLKKVLEQEYV